MNIYELTNVAASAAAPGVVQAGGGNTQVRLLSGPRRVRVHLWDDRGTLHRVPLNIGGSFSLPPGRTFERAEVYNLEPQAARVELLIGSGRLESGPDLLANEAERNFSLSLYRAAQAANYSFVGINVPSTSKYAVELLALIGFPTTNDAINAGIFGSVEASSVGWDNKGTTSIALADAWAGNAGCEALTGYDAAHPLTDVFAVGGISPSETVFSGLGYNGYVFTLSWLATPIILRPNSMFLAWVDGSVNVEMRVYVQGRERRIT